MKIENQNIQSLTPTLMTSRRSFIAGSRLVLGAGLAVGLGMTIRTSPVKADGRDCGRGNGFESEGKGNPSCPCFLLGTHIQTASGHRKIEELHIGDSVLTAS